MGLIPWRQRQRVKHLLWRQRWDLRPLRLLNGLDALLWTLFPELRVNCIVDVGAHTGEFGTFVRDLGYEGRIVSFEPTSVALANLRQRTRNDPDWRVYGLALGGSTGTADINVNRDAMFSSFRKSSELGRSIFAGELTTTAVERVQLRRLDALFSELIQGIRDPRVYLKLDTQGWDLEVLSGAGGCLERIVAAQSEMPIRPIYEGMPTASDAIAAFSAVGFDVVGMFPLNPLPGDWVLNEFDCVMVRRAPPPAQWSPAPSGFQTAH
jgi:FkbM family methyltransferase